MRCVSHSQRRRRGSVYILIVGVTLLAAAITVAATLAGRVQSRALHASNTTAEARSYAQAAVDLGRVYIAQNSNWRTARANGSWLSGTLIGSGSMSLTVTNPNGALNRFNTDPVILTGIGSCGSAVQTMQASLAPTIKPYKCLAAAMMTGGNITLGTSPVATSGVLISSNGNISNGLLAIVAANLEAAGTISLLGVCLGTKTTGATPRTLPGSNVFDYYTANGTTISLSSLPNVSGNKGLDSGVLTSAVNSFTGVTNANGIYVIDCAGQQFMIANARICATIVLLNCGSLQIRNSTVWSPAVSTLPALLLQGSVSIKPDTNSLSETSVNVNLNPTGAPNPWPTGITNGTQTDSYTPSLRGLMYVTGDVTLSDNTTLGMLICGGSVNTNSKILSFNYDANYLYNPPPGFYDVDMTVPTAGLSQMTN